jgi:hypothetical protein
LQTTLATYGTIARNLTRSLKTTATKPQVARESAYYLAIGADVLATLQNLKLGGH